MNVGDELICLPEEYKPIIMGIDRLEIITAGITIKTKLMQDDK